MKRILLLSALIIISLSSIAQPFLPHLPRSKSSQAPGGNSGIHIMTIDTLSQYVKRSTSFDVYYVDGGYVFGPGVFVYSGIPYSITTASGCHYDGIGNAKITSVLIYSDSTYKIVGSPDSIRISVYDIAADTTPTILRGRNAIVTNDLDTGPFWTDVPINANIASSFLVTVEYGGIDDTFGLHSNSADTSRHSGKGDGLGEKRSRLFTTPDYGGKWIAADDFYVGNMDADVFIIPVVDITDGVKEFKNNLFSLRPVSPVPSTGIISLEYSLTKPTTVSYSIMDMGGRLILKSNPEIKSAAEHKQTINMSSFAAGKYFVTFNAGTKSLTQQLLITK